MKARLLFLALLGAGCGAALPQEVEDYQTRCTRMNAEPIARYDGDPHAGTKNVFACGVDLAFLRAGTRPFPDGTLIVKESVRRGETFVWLTATARKRDGRWHWDEYTRNFSDEAFERVLVSESVCTGCHDRAKGIDWIFTQFTTP